MNMSCVGGYTGCWCPGVGSEVAAGPASVRRGLGCPVMDTAGSSQLHGHAAGSQDSGASGKTYLRKGKKKMHTGRGGGGNKKSKKQQREHKG